MAAMINLPVELLAVFLIIAIIILWLILKFITRMILLWRYKPEYDKGRKPEGSGTETRGETNRPLERSGMESKSVQSPVSPAPGIAEDKQAARKFPNPFRR